MEAFAENTSFCVAGEKIFGRHGDVVQDENQAPTHCEQPALSLYLRTALSQLIPSTALSQDHPAFVSPSNSQTN